ncbi:MAG TPA: hypothetical protein VGG79_08710 [Roseiarcus sp.]|jgi:hypothetical protein
MQRYALHGDQWNRIKDILPVLHIRIARPRNPRGASAARTVLDCLPII